MVLKEVTLNDLGIEVGTFDYFCNPIVVVGDVLEDCQGRVKILAIRSQSEDRLNVDIEYL